MGRGRQLFIRRTPQNFIGLSCVRLPNQSSDTDHAWEQAIERRSSIFPGHCHAMRGGEGHAMHRVHPICGGIDVHQAQL